MELPNLPVIDVAKAWQNPWVRYIVILFIGITVGALFYPTRELKETLNKTHQEEISKLNQQHSQEMQKVNEQVTQLQQDNKQLKIDTDLKISKLTQENTTLKSHTRTVHYKLVKPDGTIEERDFTDSDVDESQQVVTSIQTEFKQKVDAIETKWSQIHKERVAELQKEWDSKEQTYKKQIDTLQFTKSEVVNPKKFGIEAGMMTNKDYYGHATMDLWGPIFIGVQGEAGPSNPSMGAGLGIRF